jgi:putative flippase GtrA
MRELLGKIARFGIVGGTITAFNYWLYISLISFGLHYLIATTSGWIIAVAFSFLANKYYTFLKFSKPRLFEIISFFYGNVLQLILGSITIFTMIDILNLNMSYAFFINVAITSIFSFVFMDKIVFRMRPALK